MYVGGAGSGGTVYSVDERTGAVLATNFVENGDHSSPALGDGGVFVSYACDQAYGFTQAGLHLIWHHATGCEGGGGKTTVYANGVVLTRDSEGDLILDALTGSQLGTFTSTVAPAADQSSLFTESLGVLTAANLVSGVPFWTFSGDGQLDSAPIVLSTAAGEFVVEGSNTGMLYLLNAATGTVAWSANVGTAISAPDEQNADLLTGLAAGQGLLVIPAGSSVSAYGAAASGQATAGRAVEPETTKTITVRRPAERAR